MAVVAPDRESVVKGEAAAVAGGGVRFVGFVSVVVFVLEMGGEVGVVGG